MEIFHIVVVNVDGKVTVRTVQSDYLSDAKLQALEHAVYSSDVLSVSNSVNLDEAAEIAYHSQNAINAYKNLLALNAEDES